MAAFIFTFPVFCSKFLKVLENIEVIGDTSLKWDRSLTQPSSITALLLVLEFYLSF